MISKIIQGSILGREDYFESMTEQKGRRRRESSDQTRIVGGDTVASGVSFFIKHLKISIFCILVDHISSCSQNV